MSLLNFNTIVPSTQTAYTNLPTQITTAPVMPFVRPSQNTPYNTTPMMAYRPMSFQPAQVQFTTRTTQTFSVTTSPATRTQAFSVTTSPATRTQALSIGTPPPRSGNQSARNIVALSSLNLSGTIAACNSRPYIASCNAERLRFLDNYLTSRGYEVIYTSAMGGHTTGGHVKGNKVDFQLHKNGRPAHLTQSELDELERLGYFGRGTGALGWEPHAEQHTGGHYDICIA